MWYLVCVNAASGLLHPVVVGSLEAPRFMAAHDLIQLQTDFASELRAIHGMGAETVIAAVSRETFLKLRDKLLDYVGRVRGQVDGMAAIAAAMGDLGIEIPRSSVEALVATSVADRRALPGYALKRIGRGGEGLAIVAAKDDALPPLEDGGLEEEDLDEEDLDDEDFDDEDLDDD